MYQTSLRWCCYSTHKYLYLVKDGFNTALFLNQAEHSLHVAALISYSQTSHEISFIKEQCPKAHNGEDKQMDIVRCSFPFLEYNISWWVL